MEDKQYEELLKKIKARQPLNTEILDEVMHSADIVSVLDEDEITDEDLKWFFSANNKEFLADVLEDADDELQSRVVHQLDYADIIKIFSYMPKDEIADILGDLPIGQRKQLLNMMKASDSRELRVLLGYRDDTAGGLMTTEYIALYQDLTMYQALAKIREIAPKTEVISTIFVLNRSRQLVGWADLRDILSADPGLTIGDIMDSHVITVDPLMDQEDVAQVVRKYDLTALAVVNRRHSLLGVITADDIMDVMVDEQTEDILHMGGVSGQEEIGGPIAVSIKRRLPWLIVNLVTAFIAASAISLFEGVIEQVVALSSIMTIISGMGGNAGSQTLSVAIRGITLGEINLKDDWKLVFKEILLGLLDGALIGLITGIIVSLRYGNAYLGVVTILAMVGNLIIAGIGGYLIPLILEKAGQDPALSSSIFLTTLTDTFGFFIFLGLAQLFLPLLT
ncbi:magnesium transporter [uncultured Pseudoramibacter sp.]|jgi:magnesium transporter|uniref:Magnesium transporter MgtE n=1 Tax=Candidatus Pseudoramibacter fermentans TaxID=2594427 RepID=A0A6L5GQX8_9FIRM|nr:magnesium transporter [uncultured Pseudoramibacter sp.]MQM72655.1 magnesium transporter [Candidatus Pseudoramibacter fermentans]RRF93985.1 MAG: magnesium transporter [Eubacteriaceae bacterium]